jgi:two-component system NtrC family response regulator
MANVLIIDDDNTICKMLYGHISSIGHNTTYALNLKDGLEELSSKSFDVILLDVNLPDGNGLDALPRIRKNPSSPEIIIITGEGDQDGAEIAIESGAWAYIEKPVSIKDLTLQLARVLQYREEKLTIKPSAVAFNRERIIGSSPRLKKCLDIMAQFANSDNNILITGETGTGKELLARTIHENSSRIKNNFVVVDCAALPETLVEGMLFGHERGAFTGAEKARVGLIKEADGGTLFLDEIGELPSNVQTSFLRVLQEYRFRPLGSNKEVKSDFRLVSATNRNLEEMVKTGQFRRDLFFRVQSVTIDMPPLRNRPQDIKDLTIHYMVRLCERFGMEIKGFSPDFFEALLAYDWPGNVRELVHTLERVLTVARFEPTLFPMHLPTKIRVQKARASVAEKKKAGKDRGRNDYPTEALPRLQDVRENALSKVEKQYLEDLMLLTARDIKKACHMSGLSRSRLYHLFKIHGIDRS